MRVAKIVLPLTFCVALAACAPAIGISTPAIVPGPSPQPSSGQTGEAATAAAVEGLSLGVQALILACAENKDSRIQVCIGDALDQYAAGLAQLRDRLDPRLSGLPDIVASAAQNVRAAKTRQQAIQAVKVAISAVHKTIDLLRADDPELQAPRTREGAFVAATLQTAEIKLEKAAGL